jgi:hypothetical protein
MRTLARNHHGRACHARGEHPIDIGRHIESVNQPDALFADVSGDLQRALHTGQGRHGKLHDGHAGGTQLLAAQTRRTETSGPRIESRAI